jgi:hypothetical protein
MAEPSLSEITGLRADPEVATGNTGYVIDNRDLVRNLTQAAQFKAQNDWKKYNLFLDETKDLYKRADEIAAMDVAPQDRDRLEKEMTGFLNDIATNPKDFFSSVNSPKGRELQERLINWRKDATTSKNDRLWDLRNREFLMANPDHDTPENRAKIEGFLTNQKLGGRQPYILDMPGVYDPVALGKELNTAVEQKIARPGFTPDGKFTFTETGSRYDPEQYRKVAGNIFDLNKGGFQNTIGNLFKKLPESEQVKYKESKNPVKDWFLDFQETFRKPDQTTKEDLKANPFALETQKARTQFALEDLKNRNATNREIKVAEVKQSLKDAPKKDQTVFLLNLASSIVGNTTGKKLTVDLGKGNFSTETVVDASPNILKMFSKPVRTTIKDAAGKETISETVLEPDVITRTSDGGLRTIFYRKDKKGETVMKDGHPSNETEEIIPLPEVMSILGKEYMTKKDLPGAVNLAGEVLKQFGGDITKYAQSNNPAPPKGASPNVQSQTRTGKDGKVYTSTDGITWTAPDGTTVTVKKK